MSDWVQRNIEVLIVVAIIALLVGVAVLSSSSHAEFKATCAELRGTVVFDGRQYQCLRPASEQK